MARAQDCCRETSFPNYSDQGATTFRFHYLLSLFSNIINSLHLSCTRLPECSTFLPECSTPESCLPVASSGWILWLRISLSNLVVLFISMFYFFSIST